MTLLWAVFLACVAMAAGLNDDLTDTEEKPVLPGFGDGGEPGGGQQILPGWRKEFQLPNLAPVIPDYKVGSSPFIVGGTPMERNEWPFLSPLLIRMGRNSWFQTCACTVLNKWHVLTAAHCVNNRWFYNYWIAAGVYNLTQDDESKIQRRQVEAIFTHPDYIGYDGWKHDIAVLRLSKPLIMRTGQVEAVTINSNDDCPDEAGQTCTAGGWGRTTYGGYTSDIPLKVDVPCVNSNECSELYEPFLGADNVLPGKVCAGGVDGQGICQGDSGGPLMAMCNRRAGAGDGEGNQRPVLKQIGISSYSYGCAFEGWPAVYNRVQNYLDWIGSITKFKA